MNLSLVYILSRVEIRKAEPNITFLCQLKDFATFLVNS